MAENRVGTNKPVVDNIDYERLLLSHQEEEPLMLSINKGVIGVQHTMKSKTPAFISQLTDVVRIFINIRIQKRQSEASHLLKFY